jgi:hypothetical protein
LDEMQQLPHLSHVAVIYLKMLWIIRPYKI